MTDRHESLGLVSSETQKVSIKLHLRMINHSCFLTIHAAGLSGRGSAAAAALYAFGPPNPHQYHPSPYAMLGADLGNNWHAPSVYSSVVAAAASAGFRNSSYPPPPHDFSSFRFSQLISPQSSAAAASIASSVANHSAHHSYVGQFPHQLPPSYSLAGLTTPSSPSLVNSGPKQSVSTSSSKSNK